MSEEFAPGLAAEHGNPGSLRPPVEWVGAGSQVAGLDGRENRTGVGAERPRVVLSQRRRVDGRLGLSEDERRPHFYRANLPVCRKAYACLQVSSAMGKPLIPYGVTV